MTVPVLTAAATADRRELHREREGEEGEMGRFGLNFAAKNWLFELYTGVSREGYLCAAWLLMSKDTF